MSGEEKLSKIFYVQDLRMVCPTCNTTRETSTYDTFVYHHMSPDWTGSVTMPPSQARYFENQLQNNPNSLDTAIMHCGTYSLTMDKPGVPKKKYKLGQPLRTLNLNLDEALTKYKRLYTNNLYENIHDKICPLPLGITRKEIADFKHLRITKKEHLCYANFSITHNYRGNVIRWASTQEYINCHFTKRFPEWDEQLDQKFFADSLLPFDEFLSTLASHKFCIVPNGVGIDTDRLWECIFMNVVPIAQNNYGNRIFSKIWPMLLVERYETVNLQKMMLDFENTHGEITYDTDLLLLENLPFLLDRISFECKRA